MITVDTRPPRGVHVDRRYTQASAQERADARLFMALASPVRLHILRLLAASDVPITSVHLIAHFHVAQSTIAHHMRVLRSAGLVDYEQDGYYHPYRLDAERMRYACKMLHALTPE